MASSRSDAGGRDRLPTPTGFLGRIGLVVLVVALVFLAWKAASVLLFVFFGILLGVLLTTFTKWLSDATPLGWRVSLIVVLLLLVAGLGGVGWIVGPRLASQAGNFEQQLSSSAQSLERSLSQSGWGRALLQRAPGLSAVEPGAGGANSVGIGDVGLGENAPGEGIGADQGADAEGGVPEDGGAVEGVQGPPAAAGAADIAGSGALGNVISLVAGIISTVAKALGNVILVLFIGIFLAADPRMYQRGIVRLFPQRRRERVAEVLQGLGRTIQAWLLVQLVSMITVAILVWIGLTIIGVQPALVLAALAFFLEFIPFIGPWLAFIPAALIALTMGGTKVLWVALLYLLANIIEGDLLLPMLQQRAADVPPVLTLAGIFLFGALFGFVGILVAAPLVAVIYVFVKMVYMQDTLHESVSTPGEKRAQHT